MRVGRLALALRLVDAPRHGNHTKYKAVRIQGEAMIVAARLIVVLLAIGGTQSALAALTADYQFQSTLTSSVAGAPALSNVGPGSNAFAVDIVDGISRTVLTFPQDNGLALSPTTGVTPSNNYTIVLLARLTDVSGYRRYIDFKNATSDNGLYNLDSHLNFFNQVTGPGTPITAGSYRQVVLTRDSVTGTIVGYVDGVQQFSFVDGAGDGIISAANTLRFFVDDAVVTGEDSAGAVARIRIFDTVLTPSAVGALDRAGPAAVIPTLSPSTLLLLALLLGAGAWVAMRTRRSAR